MAAFYSAEMAGFLTTDPKAIASRLAAEQIRHFRVTKAAGVGALGGNQRRLASTLAALPAVSSRRLLPEHLRLLGGGLDAASRTL